MRSDSCAAVSSSSSSTSRHPARGSAETAPASHVVELRWSRASWSFLASGGLARHASATEGGFDGPPRRGMGDPPNGVTSHILQQQGVGVSQRARGGGRVLGSRLDSVY
eukprot:scaffold3696_cov27-Tisochrysis_lutea.AAC.4